MTKENLTMSLKEAGRLGIMQRLCQKELTFRKASEMIK